MEEDRELELLKRKKLRELKRRMDAPPPKEPPKATSEDPWSLVRSRLVGRGLEVLEAAQYQFPKETELIVTQLARLMQAGKLVGQISGEDLYAVFRQVGLPVRLNTKIVFEEHGKAKSLADKLRGR